MKKKILLIFLALQCFLTLCIMPKSQNTVESLKIMPVAARAREAGTGRIALNNKRTGYWRDKRNFDYIYSSVLSHYFDLFDDNYKVYEPSDNWSEAKSLRSLFNSIGRRGLDEVGYVLKDIDNDGIPELIFASITGSGQSKIYAVYALSGNDPKLVMDSSYSSASDISVNSSELKDLGHWCPGLVYKPILMECGHAGISEYGFRDELDLSIYYNTWDMLILEDGQYTQNIYFIGSGINDLSLLRVYHDAELNEYAEEVYRYGKLRANKPLVVRLTTGELFADWGVAFTDADGVYRQMGIYESGKDGCITLCELSRSYEWVCPNCRTENHTSNSEPAGTCKSCMWYVYFAK